MYKRIALNLSAAVFVNFIVMSLAWAQSEPIRVAVFDDQLVYFETLLRDSDCPAVEQEKIGSNLMLAEYLLLCNAIKQKIPNAEFLLIGLPIVPRVANAVETGLADVSGFGIWRTETQKTKAILSNAVIHHGEFSKGLFTSQQIKNRLAVEYADQSVDLTKLLAVSNRNWTLDWQALNCAGMTTLHVDKYEQMFQMVMRGRAEILPLGFGKQEDFGKKAFGITLYPVDGVKLVIPDSSHYLVSPISERNTLLLQAINEGLAGLRASGEFEKLYESVGAIHPKTSEWRSICPSMG